MPQSNDTPSRKRSNKGDHLTGIVWSYRRESDQFFHGKFETRHEAIGHAAIVGRILDEETHVRWHESMYRKREEPVLCGYCEFEDWYLPQIGWIYDTAAAESPFCSRECHARYWWGTDPERLRSVTSAKR